MAPPQRVRRVIHVFVEILSAVAFGVRERTLALMANPRRVCKLVPINQVLV